MVFEAREWASYVRDLVARGDSTAELCLSGRWEGEEYAESWSVEVDASPTRSVLGVEVVNVSRCGG